MARTTRVFGRDGRRPTTITFGGSNAVARRHNIDDIVRLVALRNAAHLVVNTDDLDDA